MRVEFDHQKVTLLMIMLSFLKAASVREQRRSLPITLHCQNNQVAIHWRENPLSAPRTEVRGLRASYDS